VNKYIADRFHEVQFNEKQIVMIAENIKSKEEVIKVLQVIKKNTKHPKNPSAMGITKDEIQDTIKVRSKKLDKKKGKFVNAIINMTRPMCDNIISFLSGATLIYCEGQGRGQYYHLTSRGTYVYAYMMREGVVEE
jgi:hypothetical protein